MSQLLPVLNARIGSDPIRGDLRGATRDEVERAYTRQIEADEQELGLCPAHQSSVRRSTHRSMNAQVSPTYYAMANLVIRGFIDEGNDNTESITNGVGFRNDISYGSIAPPVTYVLFAAFIILMKAATVFAMRGLKQAK